ncbi:Acetyltransferase (GNAT) family protein [Vogesella sp. LIG4]|nr:Acetyltransferase (GNAT) family protein [Vogesella sp. LIG4]
MLFPVPEQDKAAAYAVYRDGMQRVVGQVADWDEAEQRQRFAECFARGTLFWFRRHGQHQALLSLTREPHGLHLHLIVVLAECRRQGVGRQAMAAVHALCRPGQQVTLSCFRHDKAVRAFYAELGYRLREAELHHLQLEWRECWPEHLP